MQQPDRIELDPAVEAQLALDTFQVRTSVLVPDLTHCFHFLRGSLMSRTL